MPPCQSARDSKRVSQNPGRHGRALSAFRRIENARHDAAQETKNPAEPTRDPAEQAADRAEKAAQLSAVGRDHRVGRNG